jgi:hypothetical protein
MVAVERRGAYRAGRISGVVVLGERLKGSQDSLGIAWMYWFG